MTTGNQNNPRKFLGTATEQYLCLPRIHKPDLTNANGPHLHYFDKV